MPKLAISEAGFKDGAFELISINLAEVSCQKSFVVVSSQTKGANFNPEYLKVNPSGTVPTLVNDGKTFSDSTVRFPAFYLAGFGC